MGRLMLPLLLVVAIIVSALWAAEYGYGPIVIAKEHEYKVVVGVTGPRASITEPGLAEVIVFPFVDEVLTFDRRLRYLNAEPHEMMIANDERIIIDYYAIWRIVDPLEFRRQFPSGEAQAEQRILEDVKSLAGSKIAALDLSQLLARSEALATLAEESTARLEDTGVEVVDIRLNRTELPPNALESAYAQMREQRRALAREHRAQGDRMAREMRAGAERNARTTLATARAESERLRGEGDAEATRIFAAAHSRDPEFYTFVRSLEAYRKSLGDGTTMILSPDHPFLRNLEPELDVRKLPPVSSGR